MGENDVRHERDGLREQVTRSGYPRTTDDPCREVRHIATIRRRGLRPNTAPAGPNHHSRRRFSSAVRSGTGSPRPPTRRTNHATPLRASSGGASRWSRRASLSQPDHTPCGHLLCRTVVREGKSRYLPRRNHARRVSFRPVDVGRGIAASVRRSRNCRPRDRARGAAARLR